MDNIHLLLNFKKIFYYLFYLSSIRKTNTDFYIVGSNIMNIFISYFNFFSRIKLFKM